MYHRARGGVLTLAAELDLDLAEEAPFGHAYLDTCPPSLQAPPHGDELTELPLRPTAWNPPVPGSSPPASGRPWAYLTLGTAMGTPATLRTAAAALVGLDLDVLVAAGSVAVGELDGLAGDRVRVEPFVAQAEILTSDHPRCSWSTTAAAGRRSGPRRPGSRSSSSRRAPTSSSTPPP